LGDWGVGGGGGKVPLCAGGEREKGLLGFLWERGGKKGGGGLKTEIEELNQETVRRADRRQKRAN